MSKQGTGYSQCHLAEIMPPKEDRGRFRCAFCGNECDYIRAPHTVGYDLELTLRRWKDNDCNSEDTFNRVLEELERIFDSAVLPMAVVLQRGNKPKYEYSPDMIDFVKVKTKSSKILGGEK